MGGAKRGDLIADSLYCADFNYRLAQVVGSLFSQAGARVTILRQADDNPTREERVARNNRLPEGGHYIRINTDRWKSNAPAIDARYYTGAETSRRTLDAFQKYLQESGLPLNFAIKTSNDYEIQATNRSAISLDLHLVGHPKWGPTLRDTTTVHRVAAALLHAFLSQAVETRDLTNQIQIKVVRDSRPVAGARVTLQGALFQYTNPKGQCTFYALQPGVYTLTVTYPGEEAQSARITLDGQREISFDFARPTSFPEP